MFTSTNRGNVESVKGEEGLYALRALGCVSHMWEGTRKCSQECILKDLEDIKVDKEDNEVHFQVESLHRP
jgi:hypothetical protein